MIQVVLIRSHWSFDQRCLGWGHNLRNGARPSAMWRHAQGRWANHLFAFFHFVPNAAQCQPWPFNGPFWNSVGYLYDFQVLRPQKGLASTFQPNMKLVIEPASAILLHSLILLPMPPNASPGLSMGHFGIVWATCMISNSPTIKWLASTFQPTMKLVIEPAPAILLGWNWLESWEFKPITNLMLGWWVDASHFIVAGFGKLCK